LIKARTVFAILDDAEDGQEHRRKNIAAKIYQ
jgi:hypothetical protein